MAHVLVGTFGDVGLNWKMVVIYQWYSIHVANYLPVSSGTAKLMIYVRTDLGSFAIQVNNVMLLAPLNRISTLSSDMRIRNGSRCKSLVN